MFRISLFLDPGRSAMVGRPRSPAVVRISAALSTSGWPANAASIPCFSRSFFSNPKRTTALSTLILSSFILCCPQAQTCGIT